MPDTCPHCGFRLPMVVDAYCPECREGLNVTQEEPAALPASEPKVAPVSPNSEASVGTLYTGCCVVAFGFGSVSGLLEAAVAREWERAAFFSLFLLGCVAWFYVPDGNSSGHTSITGRGKTFKSSDGKE